MRTLAVAVPRQGDVAAAPALARCALYLFVFSIPFELPRQPLPVDLPTLAACVLIGAALIQPLRCFARVPAALVPFGAVVLAYVARSVLGTGDYAAEVARLVALMVQCLLVFWICYNLFRDPRVVRSVLITLVVATTARALLQLTGVAANVVEATSAAPRFSAFGQNADKAAVMMGAGLVAVVGSLQSRGRGGRRGWRGLLGWAAAAVLGIAIVQTGSRGGILAVGVAVLAFLAAAEPLPRRVRRIGVAAAMLGLLAALAWTTDSTRKRFEATLDRGAMAGREEIYPELLAMAALKPVAGWGPIENKYELGERLKEPERFRRRDAHNLWLEALTAAGLLALLPLLAGHAACARGAWAARRRGDALPLALLVLVLAANMSNNWIVGKLDWVVLALALAAGNGGWVRRRIAVAYLQPGEERGGA